MKGHNSLKFWGIFCVGAGSMISSGIFVLPTIAYRQAGSGILISYFLAGFLVLPALFTKMELATALPKSGGAYFFLDRILGAPVGMVAGIANWFSITFKSAFALLGFRTFMPMIFPHINSTTLKIITVGICILFMIFNLYSVGSSGTMQILLVVGLLLIMIEFILYGQHAIDYNNFKTLPDSFKNFDIIVAVAGMVFISYGGITKIASIAEDIPNKNAMVRATVSSFVVVQIIYLLTITILIGVLPSHVFMESPAPLSEASRYFLSSDGLNNFHFIITTVAALLAFITTANAGILTASRVPLAMSRDKMIPQIFAKSSKKGIPYVGILFTTAVMISVVLFFDLPRLAKIASLFMLLLFIGNEISLIIIRYAKVYNYRPLYKSPLFPYLPIAGIILHSVVIITMGLEIILEALIYIALSLAIYFLYAKKQVKRKSAFMHLITKITRREFEESDETLNKELMDILLAREGIHEDEFDQLIKNAPMYYLTEKLTQDEVFGIATTQLCEKYGTSMSPEDIKKKFIQREELASTLIPINGEYFVLPHVILEGEGIFGMCSIYSMGGIEWNDKIAHTAFILFCSADQRSQHLQAIMNIAQSFQDTNCYETWKKSSSVQEMRSALLLAKRNRKSEVEDIVGV